MSPKPGLVETLQELSSVETIWRGRQPFLESHGYELRPRFRPGWVPSWLGTNLDPLECDDGQRHPYSQCIDATRKKDGQLVFVKAVKPDSLEIKLATLLSTDEKRADPLNHCVPVLDHIRGGSECDTDFLVMSFLRRFDEPPFFLVEESLEFIRQTLEGIEYLHRQGIAHRDCAQRNIMMDPAPILKERFHPAVPTLNATLKKVVHPIRRSDAAVPIKYYFIDFGLSSYFPDPDEPRLVTGTFGVIKLAPELSDEVPYNPFLLDMWNLGHMFRQTFVKGYDNMEFMRPFLRMLTQTEPSNRLTASEALKHFLELQSQLSRVTTRWRLKPKKEPQILRLYRDLKCTGQLMVHLVRTSPRALFRVFGKSRH